MYGSRKIIEITDYLFPFGKELVGLQSAIMRFTKVLPLPTSLLAFDAEVRCRPAIKLGLGNRMTWVNIFLPFKTSTFSISWE
jgi:hypothetical protein